MSITTKIKSKIQRLAILNFWETIPEGDKRLYAEELAKWLDSTVQTVYKTIRKIRDKEAMNGCTCLDIAVSLQILAENKITNPLHIEETLKFKSLFNA